MNKRFRVCWEHVQRDPVLMRRVNGWLTMFWVAMIPVSLATGWVNSVTYVSALSLWALVAGHWSAWQAARVEEFEVEADVAGDVVERVVQETEIKLARTGSKARPKANSKPPRGQNAPVRRQPRSR
jgi:hypothetical protein